MYEIDVHRETSPLLYDVQDHVNTGLSLLLSRDFNQTLQHFNSESSPLPLLQGRSFGIQNLTTEQQVIEIANLVASNCWMSEHEGTPEIEIAGVFIPGMLFNLEGFSDDAVKPELVEMVNKEIAILATEEWLHALQVLQKGSFTDEADRESDVAAYLDELGVDLSLGFITRYQSRVDWFTKKYPERQSELDAFTATYY